MTTLVTGATGFVGSRLVARLIHDGHEVRILRRSHSNLDLLGTAAGHVQHAIGDVSDRDSLERAFEGISHVYHVAASISESTRKSALSDLFETNVKGTFNVVNAALHAGVKKFVHTSSMAAFGRGFDNDNLISETADWQASTSNSKYAESKHLSELEVYRGIGEGLNAVLVNPSLIFGNGRKNENTQQIVESVRKRSLPAVPSGGTNVVDVEDVVEGHVRAMEIGNTGERYFLGAENLTWKQIIHTIASALSVEPPTRVVSERTANVLAALNEVVALIPGVRPLLTRERATYVSNIYRYDNTKAITELGIHFRPFAETMRNIAASIRS